MRGFAYPNVHLNQFIGCGRYRCSAQEPEKDETPARPDAGKLNEVLAAAVLLAPELTTSSLHIYERRDDKAQPYRGASLDLAYFLASICRARRVRQPCQELEGDIWCTGAVQLGQHRLPLLTEVIQSVFKTKLQAFLATSNPDRLFLVPAANLSGETLEREIVRVWTLSAFGDLLRRTPQDAFGQKTVVEIHAHELPLLVRTLFVNPRDSDDITQWFKALTALCAQGQITAKWYWDVLTYAVQQPLDRSETDEVLLDLLHDQPRDGLKRRLYFKGAIGPDALSTTSLAVAASTAEASWATPTLRVQQVLVAIREGLPLYRTALDLHFILIPPGTASDGLMNPEAYYLAQTPVSQADWSRIMGHDLPGGASDGQRAQDGLSIDAIGQFCQCANVHFQQQERPPVVEIPSLAQWRFAHAVQAEGLGLKALRNVVDQLCRQSSARGYPEAYVMVGKRYDGTPCTDSVMREASLGFRPLLMPGV